MPAMAANSDEWLAGVVSYIRYEFGSPNRDRPGPSPAVMPEEVAKIRMEQVLRTKEWTLPELEARSREEQAVLKAQSQQK